MQPKKIAIRTTLEGLKLFCVLGLVIPMSFFTAIIVEGSNIFKTGGWPLKGSTQIISFLVEVAVWSIFLWIHFKWLKRNQFIGKNNFVINTRVIVFIIIAMIVPFVLAVIESGGLYSKAAIEYGGFVDKYGTGYAGVIIVLQNLFYVCEYLLTISMINVFQIAGEKASGKGLIPWGGLGLLLTWALVHILTNPSSAVSVMISAVAGGLLFSLSKRNMYPVLIYFILSNLIF